MTEMLYLEDSYKRKFDAVVVAHIEDVGVVLDRTSFYPGGGGQPCDYGSLTAGDLTWQVSKVKRLAGKPAVRHDFPDGDKYRRPPGGDGVCG